MRYTHLKRVLAFVLAAAMVMGLGITGAYAAENDGVALSYEKLGPGSVSAPLANTDTQIEEKETVSLYADDETVRVTILLEGESALSQLGENESIMGNAAINEYRAELKAFQNKVANDISQNALGGEKLDVVWNLTLSTNALSANVEYGKIADIEKVDGVKYVKVETKYIPMDTADTSNIVSQQMTGANLVQDSGYTGAGTRIAVIDTGIDTDHQSFAEDAFLYSMSQLDGEYELMDAEDIAAVLESLNVYSRYEGLTAEDLYINSKIPFGFNYIDLDLNVTHDNDEQGSHGSHVSGIAAANSYLSTDRIYDFNGDKLFDMSDAQAVMDFVILGSAIENTELADVDGDGTINDYDVHLIIEALDGEAAYVSAAESVGVAGVAPDAQLLAMKVFGVNGGAYQSDYMAAVEDAMLLGCDSINMSLGNPYPGFSLSYDMQWYDELMQSLEKTDIVVSISAGNSGNWADNDDAYGMMYADEAGTSTTGQPSTYPNSLSVASADNIGFIDDIKTLFSGVSGEVELVFEDATGGSNAAWHSLDPEYAGTEYEAVFLGDPSALFAGEQQLDSRIYAGSTADFEGYDFSGKVVLVSRGTYSFSDKHMNTALAGAAGVIIYNNVEGAIYASIEGSTATIPCATISLDDAKDVFALFAQDESGVYRGTLSVTCGLNVNWGDPDAAVSMSSFSSWGAIGDLSIKPEITAPGGGIYSVNGTDQSGNAYETMSGTSMAAPHVAGLAALASQYIKENELDTATGQTVRALIQSLLMSTAEPLVEETTGVEYSVRQQGAGLASIENLVNASSYVLVEGESDGKVKAELGDGTEPRSFSFTISNMTDAEQIYDLSASIITTGTTTIDGFQLSTNGMTALAAEVSFSTGSTVTVPANGSAEVEVTITIPESVAAEMEALGYTNGFYVEGFVYAEPQTSAEGEVGVGHSIPLLAWYGNWSDPSMFDNGSFTDYLYGTLERPSHVLSYDKNFVAWNLAGDTSGMYYTGNIYGGMDENGYPIGDQAYIEARNAINITENRTWELFGILPSMIRNAADIEFFVSNADTGEIYYVEDYAGDILYSNFYYANAGAWYDWTTSYAVAPYGWDYTDANGEPIPEGTRLTFTFGAVPEYYVSEEGYFADDAFAYDDYYESEVFMGNEMLDEMWTDGTVGEGAFLSYSFTVDNTAPELDNENGDALVYEGNTLSFRVSDNNYVAAVVLLNGDGTQVLGYYYPDMPTDWLGKSVTGSFNMSGYTEYFGNKAIIAVCDYAGNESYYGVNVSGNDDGYGDLVAFQYGDGYYTSSGWVAFGEGVEMNETRMFYGDVNFVAAEYVNGLIYAQDEDGKLYGISYADMLSNGLDLEECYITKLDYTYQDFAYSYAEGKLYGLTTYVDDDGYPTSEINSINLKGEYYDADMWTTVMPYQEDWVLNRGGLYGLGMAVDDAGTVYVMGLNYDWDTEALTETAHLWSVGMEYDEWSDSWMLGWSLSEIGDTGVKMDYLQSMAWDHNSEKLYWAQFYAEGWSTMESNLIEVNPETAECTVVGTLSNETCAMFAPLSAESAAKEEHANVPAFNVEEAGQPTLSMSVLTMSKGKTYALSCSFDPWYSIYTDVAWSTSDETVATVDQNGLITAVGDGACTITVTNTLDGSKFDTCEVTVASLSVKIEGIVSETSGGLDNTFGSKFYTYEVTEGDAVMTEGTLVTAPEELSGYGMKISTAIEAKGSIWASEWGNTGMVYQINSETAAIEKVYQPINGDMMFGLAYSENIDKFAGIMNYYLYVDLPLTEEGEEDMLKYVEENGLTWHQIDISPYLEASDEGFATGEAGNGSIVDVVFAGITCIDTPYTYEDTYKDYLGNWSYAGSVNYTSATTYVLLDNVGRLWYVDEITGLTGEVDEWGNAFYTNEDGTTSIQSYGEDRNGLIMQEYIDDEGNVTYNAFYIREVAETPLTDMYWNGTMPRITYHFSDICYAGTNDAGAPMFFMSLYDYWNGGTTNQLYLYVAGVGTGEWVMDYETWESYEVMTSDALYDLGTTGTGNIIASITSAEYISGLPASDDNGSDYSVQSNFISYFVS